MALWCLGNNRIGKFKERYVRVTKQFESCLFHFYVGVEFLMNTNMSKKYQNTRKVLYIKVIIYNDLSLKQWIYSDLFNLFPQCNVSYEIP